MIRRVVKIGGSLLKRSDLADALCGWFERQPPANNYVIVGGGEMIDAIRRLDLIHGLDPAATHWMCVDMLVHSEQLIAGWMPHWQRIQTIQQFDSRQESGHQITLVSVPAFYHPGSGATLPLNWQTTTDAIAGYLGIRLDADEVVLLKSCDVAPHLSIGQLAEAGIIDMALQDIAPEIRRLRVERV